MLWSTLCKAQSYQELTEAFRAVFSTIMTEENRPFVFARKKTMVVMLVVGLVRGRETLSNLKGSLILEIIKNIYYRAWVRDGSVEGDTQGRIKQSQGVRSF